MLSISQKLSLSQKLSPQQIQFQKLLQLNTIALEQRIKTELELNPILEEELDIKEADDERDEFSDSADDFDDDRDTDDLADETVVSHQDEFEREELTADDSYYSDPSYESYDGENDRLAPFSASRESLSEHLLNQLYLLDLSDELTTVGEEIIGNLDDDGYLKIDLETIVDDIELFKHSKVTLEQAEHILKEIQKFDPIGIGSRDLRECLLVQLEHSSYDHYYSFLAKELLKNYFDDFVHKRFDGLMNKLNVTNETLRSVLDVIQRLNPKPGEGSRSEDGANQITPDFIVEKEPDGGFSITLNDRSMPSVTINKTYLDMLNEGKGKRKAPPVEKTAHKFLREKFESAKWFIACIEQRRETLMKVMRAIVEKQNLFFDKGPKFLKPMIYKDIAEEIQMDISTISRVVNGKFVQSPKGIHELKYFFSEGLATDSGEEVANKYIKERIKEIIEVEPKDNPYSDDKIADMLNEEGIHIKRRTVAKYREQLRIPVARLRKQL